VMPLLGVVIAYLLGSIPFGYIIVRLMTGSDIRASGSGNIGATNVLRTTGRAATFWGFAAGASAAGLAAGAGLAGGFAVWARATPANVAIAPTRTTLRIRFMATP